MGVPDGIGCSFTNPQTYEYNITYYRCIFKNEFVLSGGALDSFVKLSDKPEHWSTYCPLVMYPCVQHTGNLPIVPSVTNWASISSNYEMEELQQTCNGHSLTNSQDISAYEFPSLSVSEIIKPAEYNTILSLLNQQIIIRQNSTKYINVYTDLNNGIPTLSSASAPHPSLVNTDPASIANDTKISKSLELNVLLNAIRKLQPNSLSGSTSLYNEHYFYDTNPAQEPRLIPNNTIPLVSKSNMEAIIDAIKNDITDCVCYSDCNGYSVCWCYGNCNHY